MRSAAHGVHQEPQGVPQDWEEEGPHGPATPARLATRCRPAGQAGIQVWGQLKGEAPGVSQGSWTTDSPAGPRAGCWPLKPARPLAEAARLPGSGVKAVKQLTLPTGPGPGE